MKIQRLLYLLTLGACHEFAEKADLPASQFAAFHSGVHTKMLEYCYQGRRLDASFTDFEATVAIDCRLCIAKLSAMPRQGLR